MDAKETIQALKEAIALYGNGPLLQEMKHRTLADKGIAGSTAAHVIEEVHTPNNYAYITFTTGTSAFQNLVGVTGEELDMRLEAGKRVLARAGIRRGDKILITYPPLINVFSRQVFDCSGVETVFMKRPSRDAFLLAMCEEKPQAVIGESSFLRCGIEDGKKLGILKEFPKNLILVAAGAALDLELISACGLLEQASLHDLYGCQEFGWLLLDGIPLREDITLIPSGDRHQYVHVVAGGLSTGDSFAKGVHTLNPEGTVVTYASHRSRKEWTTVITQSTARDDSSLYRLAKSILRMKGKLVMVDDAVQCGAEENVVKVINPETGEEAVITGAKLRLLEDLLKAQLQYQIQDKKDPVWHKKG